jgi:hypothetical protein
MTKPVIYLNNHLSVSVAIWWCRDTEMILQKRRIEASLALTVHDLTFRQYTVVLVEIVVLILTLRITWCNCTYCTRRAKPTSETKKKKHDEHFCFRYPWSFHKIPKKKRIFLDFGLLYTYCSRRE